MRHTHCCTDPVGKTGEYLVNNFPTGLKLLLTRQQLAYILRIKSEYSYLQFLHPAHFCCCSFGQHANDSVFFYDNGFTLNSVSDDNRFADVYYKNVPGG